MPMELAHLKIGKGTFEDGWNLRGLKRLGRKEWEKRVHKVVKAFLAALRWTMWCSAAETRRSSRKFPNRPVWETTPTLLSAHSAFGRKENKAIDLAKLGFSGLLLAQFRRGYSAG